MGRNRPIALAIVSASTLNAITIYAWGGTSIEVTFTRLFAPVVVHVQNVEGVNMSGDVT